MSQWKGYGPDNVLRTDIGVTDEASPHASGSGTLTYEPYFGLKTQPFSLSTNPRALYKSPSHATVLEDLLAAIRRREGLIVLTGEMGTGKTTLCRAAIYQLDRKTFTTFVPDPSLSREDLLRMLLVGFGEVSVDDLKQGRLRGAPRADLGCQLFEFLTSLESVDAFAMLVIDEAQHLTPPLLDEIRALSEMESGRRLLQIVLVGQPDLRSRLALPEMSHIAQRVTTVCELRPMSREGVGGYVAHRLAVAGGSRDRVEFSPAALDLVHMASRGVPRLVNRICDRALFHGVADRASLITEAQVTRALRDIEIRPTREAVTVAATAPAARLDVPTREAAPGGLFVNKAAANAPSTSAADLKALLDLPPVSRQTGEVSAPPRSDRTPRARHRSSLRGHWWLKALRSLMLPALAMTVMLLAGGIAVSTVGQGSVQVELPPLPASPPVPSEAWQSEQPQALQPQAQAIEPESATASVAAVAPQQTWVVQVAAFASQDRSSAMVRRLTEAGLPAYQVDVNLGPRGDLTLVRLGPYQSAEEADEVREELRTEPDYEGAFVRNITARQ